MRAEASARERETVCVCVCVSEAVATDETSDKTERRAHDSLERQTHLLSLLSLAPSSPSECYACSTHSARLLRTHTHTQTHMESHAEERRMSGGNMSSFFFLSLHSSLSHFRSLSSILSLHRLWLFIRLWPTVCTDVLQRENCM